MSDKPSYLKTLNAIANGERRAGIYLKAWADMTDNDAVKEILTTVAVRETEHAWAFEKRICELGFEVQDRPDASFEDKMECVQSDASDLEKFEALGYKSYGPNEERPNPFEDIFRDTSIDIQTGALLGRYVAEEHDSGRMLQGCFEALQVDAGTSANMSDVTIADVCRAVEALTAQVSHLQTEVAELNASK